jgi:hypothetical protein
MSTWLELRTEILIMLDIDTGVTTASDLRQLVDLKLNRKRDALYNLRHPPSLLVPSQVVTIDSTLLYIDMLGAGSGLTGLTPGFQITDLWKPFSLLIDNRDWEFVSYETWLRMQLPSRSGGDQREKNTFTIDYQDRIYLNNLPSSGSTPDAWDAVLWYYKRPADIVDGGKVEIAPEYEELLTLGVVTQFPNRFSSDERLVLLQAYTQQYNQMMREFLRQKRVGKLSARFRPRGRKFESFSSSINWGTGENSP